MPERAAAIILRDSEILLMHRFNHGREYFVLPGGGIEPGETPERACIREVKEETGLDVRSIRAAFDFVNGAQQEYYFWVTVLPGEPVLGGPEAACQSAQDVYLPEWVALTQLQHINLLPAVLSEMILNQA